MKRRTNPAKHRQRGRTPLTTPCLPEMCGTCPFRPDSPYAHLAPVIAVSALTEASRICHSTGGSNVVNPQGTGKPARLCRGARNLQLAAMHQAGVLSAPTDEAWDAARKELGC
jgi:hypothetical protein